VTNGSKLEGGQGGRSSAGEDWVRLPDAAREEIFRPFTSLDGVTLKKILKSENKREEPRISLGYSFVVVWEGVEVQGKKLRPNVEEMAEAVRLAEEHSFDYISFKPCLVRLESSQRESLLDQVDRERERKIVKEIKTHLEKARAASGNRVKILESVNLKAVRWIWRR
jgi:hypothetical protein